MIMVKEAIRGSVASKTWSTSSLPFHQRAFLSFAAAFFLSSYVMRTLAAISFFFRLMGLSPCML